MGSTMLSKRYSAILVLLTGEVMTNILPQTAAVSIREYERA